MQIVSILLTLLAVFHLISIINLFGALLRDGSFSVALPGIGLIISGWLVLFIYVAVEALLIFLAAYTAR